MKIAPNLTALVLGERGSLATAYPEAGREIRALIAVAQATEEHTHVVNGIRYAINASQEKDDRLCRAIDRLLRPARASRGRGRGR